MSGYQVQEKGATEAGNASAEEKKAAANSEALFEVMFSLSYYSPNEKSAIV